MWNVIHPCCLLLGRRKKNPGLVGSRESVHRDKPWRHSWEVKQLDRWNCGFCFPFHNLLIPNLDFTNSDLKKLIFDLHLRLPGVGGSGHKSETYKLSVFHADEARRKECALCSLCFLIAEKDFRDLAWWLGTSALQQAQTNPSLCRDQRAETNPSALRRSWGTTAAGAGKMIMSGVEKRRWQFLVNRKVER